MSEIENVKENFPLYCIFPFILGILIYNPNELIKITLSLMANNTYQDGYAKHTLGLCSEHLHLPYHPHDFFRDLNISLFTDKNTITHDYTISSIVFRL